MTRKRAQVLCGITLVLAVLGLFGIFFWAVLATWHVGSWQKHGFGNMALLAIPWTITFGLLAVGFYGWQEGLAIKEVDTKTNDLKRRLMEVEMDERAAKLQITKAEAHLKQLEVAAKAEKVGVPLQALETASNDARKEARRQAYFEAKRQYQKEYDRYYRTGYHGMGYSPPVAPQPEDFGLTPADVSNIQPTTLAQGA